MGNPKRKLRLYANCSRFSRGKDVTQKGCGCDYRLQAGAGTDQAPPNSVGPPKKKYMTFFFSAGKLNPGISQRLRPPSVGFLADPIAAQTMDIYHHPCRTMKWDWGNKGFVDPSC